MANMSSSTRRRGIEPVWFTQVLPFVAAEPSRAPQQTVEWLFRGGLCLVRERLIPLFGSSNRPAEIDSVPPMPSMDDDFPQIRRVQAADSSVGCSQDCRLSATARLAPAW